MSRKDDCIVEWDNRLTSVLVVATPTHDGPEHLARCFAAAATLIRTHGLRVRAVALAEIPEGLVLFCDRVEGA